MGSPSKSRWAGFLKKGKYMKILNVDQIYKRLQEKYKLPGKNKLAYDLVKDVCDIIVESANFSKHNSTTIDFTDEELKHISMLTEKKIQRFVIDLVGCNLKFLFYYRWC